MLTTFFLFQEPSENEAYITAVMIILLVVVLVGIILYNSISILDYVYVYFFKKPAFTHFYFNMYKLPKEEESVLKEHFVFYNRLNKKQQRYFQHRVVKFMNDKSYEGRDDFEVTKEVKLWIAATAVMLTFGMRNYLLPAVKKILIYPDIYFSTINRQEHKGEFNPRLKALVFSWKDFKAGFADNKDNLNLGIHEFIHVIQINSLKNNDISSTIFSDISKEIITDLKDENYRNRLKQTRYFREYAYINRFEFLAVLVEYFIENPIEFRQNFAVLYGKIKQMLNYNFSGY